MFHLSPKILFIGYAVVCFFMFLYSWTQVDLGLTLVDFSLWQVIQQGFQYIGYFQRPLSTALYGICIFGFFILYIWAIRLAGDGKIRLRSLRILILTIFCLLVLSYPAFSYDFFNYMFTAKTVLVYHKNPYALTPLQFTGFEPWLSFMHWTHLPSAYAPAWILFTLPPYIFGFGYFLWILWNIKLMVGFFYLAAAWGIGKILEGEKETDRMKGIVLFALNPLILVESLVSGHNDIVMSAFGILAIYYVWKKRPVLSFFLLALSVAIKEITLSLLPLYIFRKNRYVPFVCMTISLILFLVLFKREILPWYGIWILPFAAIVPDAAFLMPAIYGFSIGLLLSYMPFLYYGHWNNPVPAMKTVLIIVPLAVSIVCVLYNIYMQKKAVIK